MNCINEHAEWFNDVRRILATVETTPGLPLPQISSHLAAFHFTGIIHAEDAAEAVALAETMLSYGLKVKFERNDPAPIGSAAHYVLSAYMPSGLRVDIVAKAQHMQVVPAPREAEPELAEVA